MVLFNHVCVSVLELRRCCLKKLWGDRNSSQLGLIVIASVESMRHSFANSANFATHAQQFILISSSKPWHFRHYLPEWLSRDFLLGKPKGAFKLLSLWFHSPIAPPIMPTIQPIEPMGSLPVSSNWYLVSVRTNKRDLFLRYLEVAITQNQFL